MTRAERLAQTEERAKARLEAGRKRLAQVQAQRALQDRKIRNKRRYQVGAMADDAGLLALSDADLAGLFALLAPLTQVPYPVGMLESLLCDTERPALESVDGRACLTAVSARRAD
jgi:hypothetical protein